MGSHGREEEDGGLQGLAIPVLPLGELVLEDHQLADGGVVGEGFNVLGDLFDGLVEQALLVPGERRVVHLGCQGASVGVDAHSPEAVEEAVDALHPLGGPGLHLPQGAHEHLIQAEGIRPILTDDIIGIHHIFQGLGHFGGKAGEFFPGFLVEELAIPGLHQIIGHQDPPGILVGNAQNHALMDEALPGFRGGDQAQVVEDMVPETGVEEVQDGVLGAPHVKVHGHPVLFLFRIPAPLVVVGIDVAEVVPAGAGPLGHGVGLPGADLAGLGIGPLEPFLGPGQRRLPILRGLVVLQLRQHHRQLLLGHQAYMAIGIVHQGEGFAPIALTAEKPISQTEVDGGLAHPLLLQPLVDGFFGLFQIHPVQIQPLVVGGVAVDPVPRPADLSRQHILQGDSRRLAFRLGGLQHADDGQVELLGEGKVPGVMLGHGHDGACAIGGQHIVGNPDGNLPSIHGIDGVGAGEDTGLVLVEFRPVHVGLVAGGLRILLHGLALLLRGDGLHQFMLRRQDHVGGAKEGVGTGGVDGDLDPVMPLHREIHVGAGGAANPVPLHLQGALRPIQALQALQQFLRILGDLQHPLADGLALHRIVPHLGTPVDDLLVGQHRPQGGAPVHRLEGLIGQPLLEELAENPLGPLVIAGIAGADFPVPVKGESKGLQLPLEGLDVLGRGDLRMGPRLHRILFRRQAKGIPAHGVEDIVSLHPLVATPDVAGGIALGMPHVKPRPGRIGKHVQHIDFLPGGIAVYRTECLVPRPEILPLGLDFRRFVDFAGHLVTHGASKEGRAGHAGRGNHREGKGGKSAQT